MSFGSAVVACVVAIVGCALLLKLASLLLARRGSRKSIAVADFAKPCGSEPLDCHFHPVRYCSSGRFRNLLRLCPWEAEGVLIVYEDHFVFNGRTAKGGNLDFDYDKNHSQISYVPRRFIRDGGLSWFLIRTPEREHYYTSYRGMPDLESGLSTTGVYEAVTDSYLEGSG